MQCGNAVGDKFWMRNDSNYFKSNQEEFKIVK